MLTISPSSVAACTSDRPLEFLFRLDGIHRILTDRMLPAIEYDAARKNVGSSDPQHLLTGEIVMARFTLALLAACAIGTGIASAYDEATTDKHSLESATRKELLAKIAQLEEQLADLKSQKQQATQQQSLSKWLTFTAPLNGQNSPISTPLPQGIFALPEYPNSGSDGGHSPVLPASNREPASNIPKGASARQFNGMTVYNIPCTYRTVNRVPEYAGPAAVASRPSIDPAHSLEFRLKRQLELQPFPQRLEK